MCMENLLDMSPTSYLSSYPPKVKGLLFSLADSADPRKQNIVVVSGQSPLVAEEEQSGKSRHWIGQ